MPRPWRVKALRSDGQVMPNWVVAAYTLPSCSARAKARSASTRSVRKRLGYQLSPLRRDGDRPGGPPGAPIHLPRSPVGKRALPLTPREAARPRTGRLRPGLAFGRAESRSGWRCLRSTGCCTPAVPARWQPGLRVAHRSPRTRGQEQGVCGRLTGGLRLAPDTWAELGVDPDQVAPAVISCWQDGEVTGLQVERPQPRGGSPAHSTGDGPCRGQSRGGKEIMEPASSAGLDGWVRPQHERHGLDSSHAETTQSDYGGQFGRSA
jgi:hypothetical protein